MIEALSYCYSRPQPSWLTPISCFAFSACTQSCLRQTRTGKTDRTSIPDHAPPIARLPPTIFSDGQKGLPFVQSIDVFKYARLHTRMRVLVSLWIIGAATAWFEKSTHAFFACLTGAIVFLSMTHVMAIWRDPILDKSMRAMEKTECCCSETCRDPLLIRWYTCFLRTISSIFAIASISLSWFHIHDIQTHGQNVQILWITTTLLWLSSCIPFFIGLVQCAAHISNVTSMNQSHEKLRTIMQFRKYTFMWLLHDVVLGLFWLFMAVDLHAWILHDDPEWRIVFCSMLSWHMVIIVLQFMTSAASMNMEEGAFSSKNRTFWTRTVRIVGLFGTYVIAMQRIHAGHLESMGCSLYELVFIVVFLLCMSVGDDNPNRKRRKKSFDPIEPAQGTGLFF